MYIYIVYMLMERIEKKIFFKIYPSIREREREKTLEYVSKGRGRGRENLRRLLSAELNPRTLRS